MTKAFEISIKMADEIFGPNNELHIRHVVAVPNGTRYDVAYAELEREVKILCLRLLHSELRERERRGELVDTYRLGHDPGGYGAEIMQRIRMLQQGIQPGVPARPRHPQLHGPTVHPGQDCTFECVP